ncbi:MAG: hypothetical protein ACQEW5_26610 [Bacillota bacterium]
MKLKTKLISSILVSSLLISSTAPIISNAKTNDGSLTNSVTNQELIELKNLEKELKDNNITAQDIANGLNRELAKNYTSTPTMGTQGVKSQAAKVAAKAMIKKLGKIGRVSWDRTVSLYVNKLPISSKAKKTLKGYLKYQVVMEILNTVIDFSGTITEALKKQLKKTGMSDFLAGMTARAIVTLLL